MWPHGPVSKPLDLNESILCHISQHLLQQPCRLSLFRGQLGLPGENNTATLLRIIGRDHMNLPPCRSKLVGYQPFHMVHLILSCCVKCFFQTISKFLHQLRQRSTALPPSRAERSRGSKQPNPPSCLPWACRVTAHTCPLSNTSPGLSFCTTPGACSSSPLSPTTV